MLRLSKLFAVWLLLGLSTAALTLPASAQLAGSQLAGQTSVGEALRSLASRSELAFSGQVVSIEPCGGIMEILFSVDQTMLGSAGASYTLREWDGLWPPGQHRYVVGQRVLIFLHQSSTAGLSSPVDGMAGIVPVTSDASGASLLDIRRLAANLQRSAGQPLAESSASAISLAEAEQIVTHWHDPLRREPVRRPLPLPNPILSLLPVLLPVLHGSALQEDAGPADARP